MGSSDRILSFVRQVRERKGNSLREWRDEETTRRAKASRKYQAAAREEKRLEKIKDVAHRAYAKANSRTYKMHQRIQNGVRAVYGARLKKLDNIEIGIREALAIKSPETDGQIKALLQQLRSV